MQSVTWTGSLTPDAGSLQVATAWERFVLAIAGVGLIAPVTYSDLMGFGLLAVVGAVQFKSKRKDVRSAASAPSQEQPGRERQRAVSARRPALPT